MSSDEKTATGSPHWPSEATLPLNCHDREGPVGQRSDTGEIITRQVSRDRTERKKQTNVKGFKKKKKKSPAP